MIKNDILQRFIFDNAPVRGEYICLEESLQTILNQHPYPQPLRKLLGEALCVAGLLSAIIKFKGRLSVQFRGNGKLKFLLAQCNNEFNLRGLAKWEGEMSEGELQDALNEGVLVINLDAGLSKGNYQGIVSWEGNSLTESIEGYFRNSEQLATKLKLAVNETKGVGLLLQIVPASDKDATNIETAEIKPHWTHFTQLTDQVQEEELLTMEYEDLLTTVYPNEDIRVFPPVSLEFKCTCSRKRGEDAISLLGREEAEEELKNHHSIVVTCDFCNKEYIFDPVDVTKIFEDKDHYPPSNQLH